MRFDGSGVGGVIAVAALALSGCSIDRELGGQDTRDAGPAKPLHAGACATVCQPTEVCHRGACIARSRGGEPCTDTNATRLGAEDGCAPDAACAPGANDAGARCLAYPPCTADDSCPVGATGATCNLGFLATKAHVCLPGQCAVQADCPPALRCLKTLGDVGFCSSGDPGSPCVIPADCKNKSCFTPGGGFGLCF